MISLKNVTLSYGEKKVLDGFSLDLPSDGITCLSGPSGCGKTTLLRVIAGLLPVSGGGVLRGFERPALMFQEDRLLPWLTARENVEAVLQKSEYARASALLADAGLSGELDTYPAELSGGMKRRVALVRALAFGGDFLLLDEPFKGLDGELAGSLSELILQSRLPALIITHSELDAQRLGARLLRLGGPPLCVF